MRPLHERPLPLIDADRRLVVLWSPKSACTSVYVWFATLCGFVEEVRKYRWPHGHRENEFKKSEAYRKARSGDTSNYHVVRIIRDPYARAASVYQHAVRNHLEKETTLFRAFLRNLYREGMEGQNIHFWPQFHPLERERKPDTIINVSKADLFAELNALEARMAWPRTDFVAMTWLHELEAERKKKPTPKAPLTPETRRLIEQIYAVDFEAYRNYL